MGSTSHSSRRAIAAWLLAAAAALASLAGATSASAGGTSAAAQRPEVERVERFWTPQRMREARPIEYQVGPHGNGRLAFAPPRSGAASASVTELVPNPEEAPNAVNGRVFVRQGRNFGFCSGTAINSPTRALVLTAGHCVASGPENGHRNIPSNFLEFVPAYNGGIAPLGAFVAIRGQILAPKQWTNFGNPDFDLGAFLTRPNAEGVNVADAVGGGATIALDLDRHQSFQSFGYPGESKLMKTCASPYLGDDALSYPLPGPPTQAIRCHWPPGSSGGGWLINGGAEIDGITTYFHRRQFSQAYGPYFSQETVGRLVAGL
jgi:V8-like Glu-specific endopeptidase